MRYLAYLVKALIIGLRVDRCWYRGLSSNYGSRQCFVVAKKPKEGKM